MPEDNQQPSEAKVEAPVEILVRATINMPGLPAGATALVDPRVRYIKQALRMKYLVREPVQESR